MVICLRCFHAEVETRQTHEMFCFAGFRIPKECFAEQENGTGHNVSSNGGCGDLPRIYARFIFLCIIEQKGKCVEGRG